MTNKQKQQKKTKKQAYYKQTNYKIFRIFLGCLEQPKITKLEGQNLIMGH